MTALLIVLTVMVSLIFVLLFAGIAFWLGRSSQRTQTRAEAVERIAHRAGSEFSYGDMQFRSDGSGNGNMFAGLGTLFVAALTVAGFKAHKDETQRARLDEKRKLAEEAKHAKHDYESELLNHKAQVMGAMDKIHAKLDRLEQKLKTEK